MVEISQDVFQNIRRIQIQTTRTVNDVLAGAYHSAFKGHGMEFEDVREYQPGDEIRSIDWNVTARMQYPYIKNYREERELTVMLVVDVSASSRFGSSDRSKSELIAEIGAVLAFSAIKNNDKVGLILFSDQIEKYLPPKKGVRHVLRVIRELLVFKPEHRGTDVGEALAFLGKVQKKQGVCFLISDFLCPQCPREIAVTSKRHDLISICVTDPLEWSLPKIGITALQDLETGQVQLIDTNDAATCRAYAQRNMQRVESYQELIERAGAGFLKLRTDGSYVNVLRSFFQRREKRR